MKLPRQGEILPWVPLFLPGLAIQQPIDSKTNAGLEHSSSFFMHGLPRSPPGPLKLWISKPDWGSDFGSLLSDGVGSTVCWWSKFKDTPWKVVSKPSPTCPYFFTMFFRGGHSCPKTLATSLLSQWRMASNRFGLSQRENPRQKESQQSLLMMVRVKDHLRKLNVELHWFLWGGDGYTHVAQIV